MTECPSVVGSKGITNLFITLSYRKEVLVNKENLFRLLSKNNVRSTLIFPVW